MFLVDPRTRRLASVSDRVIRESRGAAEADQELEHELFLQQVESQTRPHRDLDELLTELRSERRQAADAAAQAGVAVVATGAPVLGVREGSTTHDHRYENMIDRYQLLGRQALVCATHVHVDVTEDEAVRVVDSLARWVPLLLALSSNSPIAHGEDTGYASWRAQIWDGWPTAGPVEPFGDRAGYDRAVQGLIESGAALDEAMIYFDVRIARNYPTVEVRVADMCTDVRDTVVVAGLARALVETAASARDSGGPLRVEMLRAARWRARRYGLSDRLVDPGSGRLEPAADVMRTLLDHTAHALEKDGSKDLVEDGVARLLRTGSGADRQRRVLQRDGLEAVVDDLIERTLT